MTFQPIKTRWTDGPADPKTPEGRAAELFRQVGPAAPLPPEAMERVSAALAAKVAAPAAVGVAAMLKALLGWKLALAAAVVAGGAVAAVALSRDRAEVGRLSTPEPVPVAVALATPEPVPGEPAAQARPPAPSGPVRPVQRPRTVASAPRPTPLPAPPVAPSEPVAPEATALALESQLLGTAIEQLRGKEGPAVALSTLDALDRRFPDGALVNESRVARIEALLAMGRRPEALALLETTDVAQLPRRVELGLVRAELLAESGRCSRAVPMFTATLAQPGTDGVLAARALFGRASCHLELGDDASGRTDMALYLERYPHGAQAEAVRAALGR